METHIVLYCIIVFTSKFAFLATRTWNIKAIAENNVLKALLSGFVIDLVWLLSITIGVDSIREIMINFDMRYLPVIICSLAGGLLGTYVAMKMKK